MKRIDFENGTVTGNILGAALPMLAAQLLNLLYNIVDRVYIARIPHVGTAALGAVGICFPLVVIITAFANLFGGGGAPLFSIERGKKEEKAAVQIMHGKTEAAPEKKKGFFKRLVATAQEKAGAKPVK